MAAAASSSSRGVAGGLYILFTLLCLVCLASSRIDDETLKNLKEDNQKIEQVLDNVKAQRAIISEATREHMRFNEALIAFAEKVSDLSPDDFLPLKENLEKIKTYIDEQNDVLDAKVAYTEMNLGRAKAKRAALSEFVSKSMSSHEAMTAFLEDLIEESSDTFLQQKGNLESTKVLLKNLKTYVNEQNELLDADMADIELKLGKSKKCLRAIEEFQAEL